jgi:hypothetical protein
MKFEDQRKLGVKLASKYHAPKTLEMLKDTKNCYEDILKTAASEVGVEKLVKVLLENDPTWALQTLRHVPNLGSHETALIAKAGVLHEGAFNGGTAQMASLIKDPLPHISNLKLCESKFLGTNGWNN